MAATATAVTPNDRPSGHFVSGSFVLDPANVAAAGRDRATVNLPGVKVGDIIQVRPRAALTIGMVVEHPIAGADAFTFDILNTSAGAIDLASQTWDFSIMRGSTGPLRTF